ncbi:helix-turn-helix transcriptional regulator [Tenacibaculum phage Gundel_1]|uniref:Helix-turn-helix transcriptional regulator n=1 Tax=Tenacibaculum phage Gundel_1 TaxID=2745672 RepID=A0A8E4ZGH4_9CAUD|nr:helix-turn-helix transcriptional regulator [Tenacibaculum phage Gundel_1]QQV91484.1 helix-turn-helix transcriptional regulator [Tenacibaculum phage Gundel_1]
MKTNFGKTLKKIRKIKGLRQEDVEAAAGMDHRVYSETENDKNNATLATLEKVSNGFNIPLAVIFWLGMDEDSIPKDHKKHEFLMVKQKIDAMFNNLYDLN